MSLRHNVLIEKFGLPKETQDLAIKFLRLASQKTAPGSGRELGEWRTGLPAVCALLASERLNSGDVNTKSAQAASCLKPKDFKRVYALVKTAIEEAESSSVVTYQQLHKKYSSKGNSIYVDPYIMEAENELQPHAIGFEIESTMFRSVCYFWVLSIFSPRVLPSTEKFAYEQELALKKFANLLSLLNEHAPDLRTKIMRGKRATTQEATASSSTSTPTTQRSPRKPAPKRELPNNDTPKKPAQAAASTDHEPEQESPLRRSSRTASPMKKVVGSTPSVPRPWVKPPIRELPSKDSPKKRPAEPTNDNEITQDDATLPSTPTKKRRITSLEKPPKPSSPSSARASLEASTLAFHLALASPTKQTTVYSTSGPLPSSPLKRSLFSAGDMPSLSAYAESSCSDESEPEVPVPRRRFRPVYVDSQQWEARDPRLAKVWKKAETGHASNPQRTSLKRK